MKYYRKVTIYQKVTCGIILGIKMILYHLTCWKTATIRTPNTHCQGHGLITQIMLMVIAKYKAGLSADHNNRPNFNVWHQELQGPKNERFKASGMLQHFLHVLSLPSGNCKVFLFITCLQRYNTCSKRNPTVRTKLFLPFLQSLLPKIASTDFFPKTRRWLHKYGYVKYRATIW